MTLTGRHVRLEPLSLDHLDALVEIGLDPDIWRWSPQSITTAQDLRAYVETALDERERGVSLPFATVSLDDNRVVGSTRYGNVALGDRRVEIGWTWIAPAWQRSAVNTEAKLLMLTHAFETLGCRRVELKTDGLNERSRRAIRRLGAREEGTFRKHMSTDTGRVRDTVMHSIVDDEWPTVKTGLTERLARG
ncbi:MAG: GNAT family protein [Acidobacteriota bacterium]